MNLINNIYKERLLNKSIKNRYKIEVLENRKLKYFLDNNYYHIYIKGLGLLDSKLITFKNGYYSTYLESYNDFPSIFYYHNNSKAWHKNGKLHRENDLPAVIQENGDLAWWIDGKQHRDDDKDGNPQPARTTHLGEKDYFKHDKTYFPYGYDKHYNSK